MRLAEFILANQEPILAEWEVFAQSCVPASGTMDVTALRDHAREMLAVIATDLATPQARRAGGEGAGTYPSSRPGRDGGHRTRSRTSP